MEAEGATAIGRAKVIRAFAVASVVLVALGSVVAATRAGMFQTTGGGPTASVSSGWQRLGVVIDIGPAGALDSAGALNPYVLKDGVTHHIWYRGTDGSRNRILHATSLDGIVWAKEGLALDVLTPPFYFDGVAGQSVMREGGMYRMWFGGGFWSGPYGLSGEIYYAESSDAVSWSVKGVALGTGPAGSWDGAIVQYPMVMKDSSGTYILYYAGWAGSEGVATRIGIATSSDGVTFTRAGSDPALDRGPEGSWEEAGINMPFVLAESPKVMWYSGGNLVHNAIGIARYSDAPGWTKDPDNPEFSRGATGEWDGEGVFSGALLPDGPTLRMYYSGNDGARIRIGLATQIALTVDPGSVASDPGGITSSAPYQACPLECDRPANVAGAGAQGSVLRIADVTPNGVFIGRGTQLDRSDWNQRGGGTSGSSSL